MSGIRARHPLARVRAAAEKLEEALALARRVGAPDDTTIALLESGRRLDARSIAAELAGAAGHDTAT